MQPLQHATTPHRRAARGNHNETLTYELRNAHNEPNYPSSSAPNTIPQRYMKSTTLKANTATDHVDFRQTHDPTHRNTNNP